MSMALGSCLNKWASRPEWFAGGELAVTQNDMGSKALENRERQAGVIIAITSGNMSVGGGRLDI